MYVKWSNLRVISYTHPLFFVTTPLLFFLPLSSLPLSPPLLSSSPSLFLYPFSLLSLLCLSSPLSAHYPTLKGKRSVINITFRLVCNKRQNFSWVVYPVKIKQSRSPTFNSVYDNIQFSIWWFVSSSYSYSVCQ